MKRKHLVAALSLLLLVAVVATSVHVMHRDAMAGESHVVWVLGGVWHNPLPGVSVTISVKTGINPDQWSFSSGQTDETGKFSFYVTPHTTATEWFAEVTNWGNGIEPWQNPENPMCIEYNDLTANFWYDDWEE